MPQENTQRSAEDIEAELDGMLPEGHEDGDEEDLAPEGAESEAVKLAESEAGRKGWVPKDQFKGDASKWVDAQTFIERGERFNANLQREVALLKQKIESFEGTKAAFSKFHEETIAKKNEEIKETISALRVQRSQAMRDGEDETVVQIEDRIDLLKDQQKEIKEPVQQETIVPQKPDLNDPVISEWIEDGNKWFADDSKLRDFAIALGDDMIKNGETVRGRKFLDKVAARMAEEFPRRFKAKETVTTNSAVEGEGNANNLRVGGKTERDLPSADRDLMRQFIKEGWTTKEKFLASYFSTNK